MYPDHTVGVGFGKGAQLFKVWFYVFRPALTDNTEHLGSFHPYPIVEVTQQLGV